MKGTNNKINKSTKIEKHCEIKMDQSLKNIKYVSIIRSDNTEKKIKDYKNGGKYTLKKIISTEVKFYKFKKMR
jgi:hypothetical protein